MARRIFSLVAAALAASLLIVSCSTMTKAERAAEAARVAELVSSQLDNRQYFIAVDYMYPLRGGARHLSSGYYLKIDGDKVDSYLPYFGAARNVPYGGGKALNFEGTLSSYQDFAPENGLRRIVFEVTNEEDTYAYQVDVFDNGKASITVLSRFRDTIRFSGYQDVDYKWEKTEK